MAHDRRDECLIAEDNYWVSSVAKRQVLARERLDPEWVKQLFDRFIGYLMGELSPKAVALRMVRYSDDAVVLGRRFIGEREITREAILGSYTAEELRRAQVLFSFLRAEGFDTPSREEVACTAERRRVDGMLIEAGQLPQGRLVLEFARQRESSGLSGSLASMRSCRLSIRPALDLARVAGEMPIDQAVLVRYLTEVPGQRAAVSGFVGFLRRSGRDIALPRNGLRKVFKTPHIRTDAALAQLMGVIETTDSFPEMRAALAGFLAGVYGLPLSDVLRLRVSALERDNLDRIRLKLEGFVATVSDRLGAALGRYLQALAMKLKEQVVSSHPLFPGRPISEPATVASVTRVYTRLVVAIKR